ncbi:MAG: DUF177 domain-containing protein [Solirubrobacterales bacterium]
MSGPAGGFVDLARLALDHGQGRRLELDLEPGKIRQGPNEYLPAPGPLPATLEISRTSGGWAFHLRFAARLEGTCVRCLEQALIEVDVDAREIEEPASEDEELRSPYVDGLDLDVARWARDALVLAMPAQPVCREDCRGLCPVCGESLNDADPAAHVHQKPRDPRWAKLDQLKLDQ